MLCPHTVAISQGRAIQLSGTGAEALQGAQTLTVASSAAPQPAATILQCAAQPGDSPQQYYIQGGQVLIQGIEFNRLWWNLMCTCLNFELWGKKKIMSGLLTFRYCRKCSSEASWQASVSNCRGFTWRGSCIGCWLVRNSSLEQSKMDSWSHDLSMFHISGLSASSGNPWQLWAGLRFDDQWEKQLFVWKQQCRLPQRSALMLL